MNPVNAKYSLKLSSLPSLEFHVLRFQGRAALNELYEIKISALIKASSLEETDEDEFFNSRAVFTVEDGSGKPGPAPSPVKGVWHGLAVSFKEGARIGEYVFLDLTLAPSLSMLKGQIQNRIHLNASVPEIVEDSLKFGGLDPNGWKFKLDKGAYAKKDFVFQHGEDLLDFVFRRLEHEGIALYYEQGEDQETIVMADWMREFPVLKDGDADFTLRANLASGLLAADDKPQLFNFQSRRTAPRAYVRLNDYNWEDPTRPLSVRVPVASYGRGELYLYGENFQSIEEGKKLADIRKEEELALCRAFTAEAAVAGLQPGQIITLDGHPKKSLNKKYLVREMVFSGNQISSLSAGLKLQIPDSQGDGESRFRQSLVLQGEDTPYRPRRARPRPAISGSITAWIDGAGDGKSPEIDAYGRYKVLLPLDLSGRDGGRASAWIRMAQPYVGNGYGQNFPLAPGVEVLLTFIDGNPDRPVISGAVANAETGSMINSATNTLSGIGTRGGSSLLFGEQEGKQNLSLSAGSDRGNITLASGSPTQAQITADIVSNLTTMSLNFSTLYTDNLAGYQYSIETKPNKILQMVNLLDQAFELASDIYTKNIDPVEDDPSKTEYENAEKYPLAVKALQTGVFASNSFYKIWKYYNLLNDAASPDLPKLPHLNLFNLTGDDVGSKTIWNAKRNNESKWIYGITTAMLAAKVARDVQTSYQAASDYASENRGDNSGDSAETAAKKKLTAASAIGTPIAGILEDIALYYATIRKLYRSGNSTAKGFLIENKDSYVNIQANGYGSLSAKNGPVVLESAPQLIGDSLRYGVGEEMIVPDLLEQDEPQPGSIEPTFFKDRFGVFLRSPRLVRAISEEVSLWANRNLFAKSAEKIQLATGENTAIPVPMVDTTTGHGASSKEVLEINHDKSFKKGVMLETLSSGHHIKLETRTADSEVKIIQGAASVGAESSVRALFLTQDAVTLQLNDAASLEIKGQPPEAELKVSASEFLSLKTAGATLQFNDNNKLSLTSEGASLENPVKCEIKGGSSSATFQTGVLNFSCEGQAKVDGQIIQLG
ncbi:MAG: type VI secretion system tip protein VgrG [Deltaproteobacteria bacterium]|jgi:type VI secretion system VgrG family protein|nr:type VI secretion system tip protein VgrG [Deltaproteobacteria bacterium]